MVFAILFLPSGLLFRALFGYDASNWLVLGCGSGLALGGTLYSCRPRRCLIIHRDRVEWHVAGLLRRRPVQSMSLRDVESVILVRGGRFGRKRLRIEGDRGALEIGQGLRTRDLEWLREYLLYAAANA
jgi:hypothetical protein